MVSKALKNWSPINNHFTSDYRGWRNWIKDDTMAVHLFNYSEYVMKIYPYLSSRLIISKFIKLDVRTRDITLQSYIEFVALIAGGAENASTLMHFFHIFLINNSVNSL